MDPLSLVKLEGVNGTPTVKISNLPCPLKIGDPLGLRFRITRQTGGRYEILEVNGQFRVTAVGFDGSTLPRRQLLSVESLSTPPRWRSIKKPPQGRPLAPARAHPTPIR